MSMRQRTTDEQRKYILKLARLFPRPTNKQIREAFVREFDRDVSERTIGRVCKGKHLPTSSKKSHTSQGNLNDRVSQEIMIKRHTERLFETVDQIHACLHNPHLELEAWTGPSEPLRLANHNWVLLPDFWVELTTPDFGDENLWGPTFPLLKQHLQENPFWDHLEGLKSYVRDLAKTIDLAVEELLKTDSIEGADKLRESWGKLRKLKNFTLSHSRTPVFLPPNWEEIEPPYGDNFAAQVCQVLVDGPLPELNTNLWNLVKKLAELNEDLRPDAVERQIASTTCSECKEIKLLLGNRG